MVPRPGEPRPLPPGRLHTLTRHPDPIMTGRKDNVMHAVILAGGKGVRLRPYTTALPKPLVPIGDEYSILDIVLRQLAQQGFDRATLAIGYLGQPHPRLRRRRPAVGHRGRLRHRGRPARHHRPGPADPGPAARGVPRHERRRPHRPGLRRAACAHHSASGAPLTVATYARRCGSTSGCSRPSAGKVVGFTEKPTIDYRVSMGVYGLSKTDARSATPPGSRWASTTSSSTCSTARSRRRSSASTASGSTSAGPTTTTARTPSSA